jgi:anti-sigma B factor antagonist
MKTATRTLGEVLIVSLHGKIMSSQDTVEMHNAVRAAIEANTRNVVLDLSGLDWMNSTGLGGLVAASGRLRNVDGHLKLAAPNATVSSLLALNKLNLIFDIFPTVEAAVASFK